MSDQDLTDNPDNASHNGTVVTNFGNEILIEDQTGQRFRAIPRQSLPVLITGDNVSWEQTGTGHASIYQLHERHGTLSRQLKNKQEKIIATNIDIAMIVCTHKPAYKTGLIDRYLAACEMAAITPWIVFNKSDLLPKDKRDKIINQMHVYRSIGYPVFFTSAKTGNGIAELRTALVNKTAVLVGQSGVGKSSLIRALVPSAKPRIADISGTTQKGRHTTTHSELYRLENNAIVIDSPGIREFGLKSVDAQTLAYGFIEFREHISHCRFRDCHHQGEPGCALEQSCREGKIRRERLESYQNILSSFKDN